MPSVASHLVLHSGVLSRLLSVISGFFTNQILNKRITYPPDPTHAMDVEAYPFRSKRYMPIFSDIRYICNNGSVKEIISRDINWIAEFVKVCAMFCGIQPNKRAKGNHVEYESDSWINVFNVTLSLSRVVKAFGEAFVASTPKALFDCIEVVMHQISSITTMEEARLDREQYTPPVFHKVKFGQAEYGVLDFDVLSGWVSFHNSPHWLLAELFKQTHLLGKEQMAELGHPDLRTAIRQKFGESVILEIIEFPLRGEFMGAMMLVVLLMRFLVLVLIAQVRAGLWVRNGFPIRGQLVHYRDFMLRELCYDQDLFLMQMALVLIDPDLVLVSMLDRFQLRDWMSGNTVHPECEPAHLAGLVEELLFTLIYCVGDPSNANQLSLEEVCRRETIHALAPGPISFTDLCKRVPERLIEEASFEHVLQQVSDFKRAEGVLDSGSYELKEAYFANVDPFFYHYSRARREEVDGVLKAKLTKGGMKDPIIIPKPYKITTGPFIYLEDVLKSPVLLQIMFYTISNFVDGPTMTEGSVSTDAILDQAFQLTMIALIQVGLEFTILARNKQFASETTLVGLLCDIEVRESTKSFRPRIQWCLSRMEEHDPSIRRLRHIPEQPVADASLDTKKRAAKARQDAIMKQFANAQKMFLDAFDEEGEEGEQDGQQPSDGLAQEQVLEPCILCQEKMDSARSFGTIGAVHPSRLVRYSPLPSTNAWNDVLNAPESLDREIPVPIVEPPAERLGAFPSRNLRFGTYGSTCGHMVHYHCWNDYVDAIRSRHRVQPQRHQPECLERNEFVCPLCKSLGNCLLPVCPVTPRPYTRVPPFAEWLRSLGIELLRSTPDRQLERHQYTSGTGEFMFWSAEDTAWPVENGAFIPGDEVSATVRAAVSMISKQSTHIRSRLEPPYGERGTGVYIPEGLGAYTLSAMEVAYRGTVPDGTDLFVQKLPDTAGQCIRGIVGTLSRMAAVHFRSRRAAAFDSIRLAIAKRLLPEWTREEQYRQPFLLRDPYSLLFECAAVSPELIPNVSCALYYATLLRALFGLTQHLLAGGSGHTPHLAPTRHGHFLGSVAVLMKSAARHSPALDRATDRILVTFGEGRLEQLVYAHTLPALRALLIFTHSICPWAIAPVEDVDMCEYERILKALSIPPPAELHNHESIQVLLAGWCTHYGQLYTVAANECTIRLEYPHIYYMARLPQILDLMWQANDAGLTCTRCNTMPADPAICLICGTLCCHQSYCCRGTDWSQRGECNMHTRECVSVFFPQTFIESSGNRCSGPIGIYFLLKRCVILYLYGDSGSFTPPPYVDSHGEIDIGLR